MLRQCFMSAAVHVLMMNCKPDAMMPNKLGEIWSLVWNEWIKRSFLFYSRFFLFTLFVNWQFAAHEDYSSIHCRTLQCFSALINGEPSRFETTVEYSGPEFSGKLGGSVLRQGKANLSGTVKGEYQVGNQLKRSLEVALEQTLEVNKLGFWHWKVSLQFSIQICHNFTAINDSIVACTGCWRIFCCLLHML